MRKSFKINLAAAVLSGIVVCGVASARNQPILAYIKQTWGVLTRSNKDLATAAVDPKFHPGADGKWAVYIPDDSSLSPVAAQLKKEMSAADFGKIDLLVLPEHLNQLKEQGLLFLPQPYVVPGGRFNEMYGWDSYFIQLGLLRDGELQLAKDMADNFLYETQHYAKVLNANRTYYLTRSQPPFLTQMILGVYNKTHDRKWLENALPLVEKYYRFWTEGPHLTDTGLSRYYDFGEGPAPESVSAERDAQGRTHYQLVEQYFRTHTITDYDVSQYYDKKTNQLTPLFYKSDRSMRESGFDPSNRFGPFDLDIIHYDPVCLNSLLYVMERQTAEILEILGKSAETSVWRERARKRAQLINTLSWDQRAGLYFDYDFATRKTRHYPFLTTFYPLWAGLASKEQAAAVEKNLSQFERPGGLQTSTYASGNQWDAPFGWAPLEMIAIDGLRRYGYNEDAERISMEFLSLVRSEFLRQGYIVEKYDVVHRGSNVSANIHFGYSANQAGFGWTNAAFTELYDQLTPGDRQKLMGSAKAASAASK
jgi:alpha,alpha-trehalase